MALVSESNVLDSAFESLSVLRRYFSSSVSTLSSPPNLDVQNLFVLLLKCSRVSKIASSGRLAGCDPRPLVDG